MYLWKSRAADYFLVKYEFIFSLHCSICQVISSLFTPTFLLPKQPVAEPGSGNEPQETPKVCLSLNSTFIFTLMTCRFLSIERRRERDRDSILNSTFLLHFGGRLDLPSDALPPLTPTVSSFLSSQIPWTSFPFQANPRIEKYIKR